MRWHGRPLRRAGGAGSDSPPTPAEQQLRHELHGDVQALAVDIGERHLGRPEALAAAADFIAGSFAEAGHPEIDRQPYTVEGQPCENVAVEIRGTLAPDEVVVVGAHYDSVIGSPGANDNGTGVAALLAYARRFSEAGPPGRTLRLVAFTNEEMPYTHEAAMGSAQYARRCRQRGEQIVAMLALETMGYYSDVPGSQSYPLPMAPFYPRTGSFVGFVSNLRSRRLLRRSLDAFRRQSDFPCQGAALPGWVPGVSWSDHASFWAEGYPALMITDTAPFRYPHYHRPSDTPDKVDYDRLARAVEGVHGVVRNLVG